MMEDAEFKARLCYLGRDVSYVGRKFKEDVEKCLTNFETTDDPKKFCNKLAQILSKFSNYTSQYAKDLLDIINNGANEEKYGEAIKTLQHINCKPKTENCNTCVNQIEQTATTSTRNEDSSNAPIDSNILEESALSQNPSVHIKTDEVKEEQLTQENLNNSIIELSSSESLASTIVYNANEEPKTSITKSDEDAENITYDQETLANSPANIQDVNTEGHSDISDSSITSQHEEADRVEFDCETIANSSVKNHSPLAMPLLASLDDSDATVASLTPPRSPNIMSDQAETYSQAASCSQVFVAAMLIQEDTRPHDAASDTDFSVPTQVKNQIHDENVCTNEEPANPSDEGVNDNGKLEFFKILEIRPKPLAENSKHNSEVSLSATENDPKQSLKFQQKKSFMRLIAEYYLKKKKEQLQPETDDQQEEPIINQATESMDIHEDSSRASDPVHIDDNHGSEENDEAVIDNIESEGEEAISSPKIDDSKASSSSEGDLDATQKADIRMLKLVREETPILSIIDKPAAEAKLPIEESEEMESQITNPFKRKSVQPLPESQSSSSPDSEATLICPLTKRAASTAANAQSDLESASTDIEEVVNPYKKKVVQPLPNTQSSDDTDTDHVVSCFKKKTVQPLPSSDSNNEEDLLEVAEGEESRGQKRVLLSDESDDEVDFDAETLDMSGSPKEGSDLERDTQDFKRRKVSDEDSPKAKDCHGSSASDQLSQLDDNDRDDLLQMLNESNKDSHMRSPADDEAASGALETDDGEKSEPTSSQFDLGDSERDNLLNLLTDKEQEESKLSKEGDELLSQDRDELLDLLNGKDEEEKDDGEDQNNCQNNVDTKKTEEADADVFLDQEISENETNENEDGATEAKTFKFSNEDKDELLDLLSQEAEEVVSSDDESSTASEEDLEKRSKKRKKIKRVARDMLGELVEEFEHKISNKDCAKASEEANIVPKTSGDGNVMGLLTNFNSNSIEDSDAESILLDILKEETVVDLETKKRKPENLKDCKKRALEAYKSLLEDDEDISDLSSDTDDLEIGFANYRARQIQKEKNIELRRRFGICKELYIDVEDADVSGYCLPVTPANDYSSSEDDEEDKLCDLTTVMQKQSKYVPIKRQIVLKTTRARSVSASSASPYDSSSDTDDIPDNRDAVDSPPPIEIDSAPHSDREHEDRWANDLFENIKNSSDDDQSGSSGSSSHDDDDGSSDGNNRKKKKISLPPLEGSSKNKSKGDGESSSSSSSSSDTDSGVKKATDIKLDDLDSSDEADFVAVRKDISSWRQDPLLKGCLSSSDSDANTDQKESRAKRPKKRKSNKQKRGSKDGTNSDATASDLDGQKTPTKKLISSDSSGDSDLEIVENETTPKKAIIITDDDDSPTKIGKGRRNIRALVEFEDLAEATQRAKNDEKERIKRLQERDKAMERFTQSQEYLTQFSQDEPNPLILDVHEGTQIKIHPKIVERLKPHQRDGIRFMWDSCYLSLKDIKKGYPGSGCILAHCMGLGKTLQALALIQALFTYQATKTKHVLVVCPLSTVLNWRNEYHLAYKDIKHSHVKLYTIENTKAASKRFEIVKKWWASGGVLVLGYECFGLLINDQKLEKWEKRADFRKEDILKALINPGPDLVICDEGHLLRNKQSQRTLALNKLETKRRIVLTGTPLQNNLLEYYYMVQFVKPDLLGNEKEYKTNFVNPITNGQFGDSTAEDIMYMKKRTHCLHKILNKTVQRVEDTELKGYLPKLIDQVVFVKLSDLQVKLYNTFLDSINSRPVVYTKTGSINRKSFLADVQILRYICLHPNVVETAEKNSKARIKEQDVLDDNMGEDEVEEKLFSRDNWSKELLATSETKKLESGKKLMTAIAIVKEATANGDKVLIFSQSYAEMDNLESFLKQHLKYVKNHDYYRMDGTISPEVRTHMCDKFNNEKKKHFKVFIMSTKVGGLGLNLTAANRVIIMNVNWNPSYDTQSVFRAYRFGQTKPVYVYRLIAVDTVEEKMYQRVVTKLAVAHRVVDKHQITRHYTAADIQEFYSARPCMNATRPVPKVPEDRVLATLIQRYPFIYRWHEHQTLLANRPEEDLDETEKNAAWEEYEKKLAEPPPIIMQPGIHSTNSLSLAQPGPSGIRNKLSIPANNDAPFIAKRQNQHYPDHNYSLPKNTLIRFSTSSSEYFHPYPKIVPINFRLIPYYCRKTYARTRCLENTASPNFVPRSLFADVNLPPPGSVTNPAAVSTSAQPTSPQLRVNPQNIRPTALNRKLVQNPMNLSKKTDVSIVQNPAQVALRQQMKKAIVNGAANSGPVKPIAVQPPLVTISPGPATTTTTSTSTTDTSTTTNQPSPLQRRMRTFMDHLHRLQKEMQSNGTASDTTKKTPQPIDRANGSNRHAVNGTTSKMKINGIPVTRMVRTPGTNHRMVKRLVPKGSLSPRKRILLSPSKAGKSPIRFAPAQLTDNPLQRRMAINFNKLATATSPHKFRNGAHPVRRNGQSSSQEFSPPLNSNKENIKKRKRPLLRGFHRIAASIDLSKDDGGMALSPEMIKKFKRKGVSINYVRKGGDDDVIKLD